MNAATTQPATAVTPERRHAEQAFQLFRRHYWPQSLNAMLADTRNLHRIELVKNYAALIALAEARVNAVTKK